jgi:hypothetical protein
MWRFDASSMKTQVMRAQIVHNNHEDMWEVLGFAGGER